MPAVRRRGESLVEAAVVAGAGGFLDAVSFVTHGTFASAQTGNVVIGAAEVTAGRLDAGLTHLPPIGAFCAGVALTRLCARTSVRARLHRPTIVLLALEVALLALAGVIGGSAPAVVFTMLLAFVGGVQLTTFRSVIDTPYSSTMTTGNLRRLVEALTGWVTDRSAAEREVAGRLGLVFAAFVLAAGVGALLARSIGARAAWVPAAILVAVGVHIWRTTSRRRGTAGPDDPSGGDGPQPVAETTSA